MATDLFKQVLFNDGEGLVFGDLNDNQRFLGASLFDQFLASMIPHVGLTQTAGSRDLEFGAQSAVGAGFDWGVIATSRAFCLTPGQAFLRKGSASNKVNISAGTLLQLTSATLTGDDPKFLAYTFNGTEEVTIGNGDTTNPRMDLIQMKLEYVSGDSQSRDFEDAVTRVVTTSAVNKKRRVQCTLSVKAGTAAATPAIPEPDSGYCVLGSVYVQPTFDSADELYVGWDPLTALGTDNAFLHDQRMPFRVRRYRVTAEQMGNSANWTLSTLTGATSTNATNELRIPVPGMGRVLGAAISIFTASVPPATITMGPISPVATGGLSGEYSTACTVSFGGGTGGIPSNEFTTFEAAPLFADATPVEPTQSSTTKIGLPIWTNGWRSLREELRTNTLTNRRDNHAILRIVNAPNSMNIGSAWFWVAEGL